MKKWVIIGTIALIIGAAIFILTGFHIDSVNVTGCEFSDPEEVRQAVLGKSRFDNTLYLYFALKAGDDIEVPFVSGTEIEITDRNDLTVSVYEKAIAGCVRYYDSYIYFDNDGNVLEVSRQSKENIPCIDGLEVNEWVLGSKMPIADSEKFTQILNMTQLIDKYSLKIDSISFSDQGEIEAVTEGVTVLLGDGSNLSLQMMNLGNILTSIEGKKGILYMKDYSEENKKVSFKEEY